MPFSGHIVAAVSLHFWALKCSENAGQFLQFRLNFVEGNFGNSGDRHSKILLLTALSELSLNTGNFFSSFEKLQISQGVIVFSGGGSSRFPSTLASSHRGLWI